MKYLLISIALMHTLICPCMTTSSSLVATHNNEHLPNTSVSCGDQSTTMSKPQKLSSNTLSSLSSSIELIVQSSSSPAECVKYATQNVITHKKPTNISHTNPRKSPQHNESSSIRNMSYFDDSTTESVSQANSQTVSQPIHCFNASPMEVIKPNSSHKEKVMQNSVHKIMYIEDSTNDSISSSSSQIIAFDNLNIDDEEIFVLEDYLTSSQTEDTNSIQYYQSYQQNDYTLPSKHYVRSKEANNETKLTYKKFTQLQPQMLENHQQIQSSAPFCPNYSNNMSFLYRHPTTQCRKHHKHTSASARSYTEKTLPNLRTRAQCNAIQNSTNLIASNRSCTQYFAKQERNQAIKIEGKEPFYKDSESLSQNSNSNTYTQLRNYSFIPDQFRK